MEHLVGISLFGCVHLDVFMMTQIIQHMFMYEMVFILRIIVGEYLALAFAALI